MKKLLLFLIFTTILFSCAKKENKYADKKILRYNESAGISYLDPAHSERFEDNWAMRQLYNGLVRMDKDLNIVSDLAKDWSISENGLEYTFNLRTDVYFHNNKCFKENKGPRVVAEDFVKSFYRITDYDTYSQGKFIFKNLNKNATSNRIGVEAVNDSTLKIHLNEVQRSFLSLLTLPYCSVISQTAVDYYGKDYFKNPVGTGPFKFKIWKEGVKLVLIKNEQYFEYDREGIQLPYIDVVAISFIKSKMTEFQNFNRGKLDFISGLHESYQSQLLTIDGELKEDKKDKFYLLKQPWLKTDYIGILVDKNEPVTKSSPLKNKFVRQAVNYAIDREGLIKHLRNGIGVADINGFLPDGLNSFNGKKINGYKKDLKKVQELLAKAGFEDGAIFPEITLIATENYKEICDFIANNLSEAGMKCKIEMVLPSTQKQMVATHTSNFFRKSWTCDYPDPSNFLMLFYSKNFAPDFGPNYTHYSNPSFDILYERSERELNDFLRQEYFYQMEEMIKQDAPVVPLFYDELVRFVSNRVSGIESNAMNQLDLRFVKLN